MKNMTLQQIAHAVDGQLFLPKDFYGDLEREATGVVIDNRLVEAGGLFIPIIGNRVDGHTFIKDAFERGAMGVLSQRPVEHPQGPCILVQDTQQALKDLGAYYRRQVDAVIVGVVGSVGKTSTKEMVASVLEQRYHVLKTQGNLNNEIGLPLTLLRIRREHEAAVVEMGISDFGEMDRLGHMAAPDIVVFTNVGDCHLENLTDRDGVLRAKSEVFAHMPQDGVAILNGDDDKLRSLDTLGRKVVFYGLEGQDYSADGIDCNSMDSVTAMLHLPQGDARVSISLPGKHNVRNALAAAAVGVELGLCLDEIVAGIRSAGTITGRNHFIDADGVTVMDDCYNANPMSMKASLEVLSHASGRRIAVLGDMGELGGDERRLHYEVGKNVAASGIDCLFTAGVLAKEMARAVSDENSSCHIYAYETRDDLIPALLEVLQPGDTVLVKASHFMEFAKVVEAITNR